MHRTKLENRFFPEQNAEVFCTRHEALLEKRKKVCDNKILARDIVLRRQRICCIIFRHWSIECSSILQIELLPFAILRLTLNNMLRNMQS